VTTLPGNGSKRPLIETTEEWIERGSRATPVLYLDLDDTVRKGKAALGRFVNGASDVEVFPEIPDILREYKRRGWRIVAISNQGGVAMGFLSMEECAAGMLETQRQCRGAFDKILFCTHHPEAADPEYAVCWCRKPRIGLILEACHSLSAIHNEYYPPHLALFIGDLPEDEQCASNANIEFMNAETWRSGGWKDSAKHRSYVTAKGGSA
jgi:D-glycero-D-manno-heptose 1,7-bisphosphate phosphatase